MRSTAIAAILAAALVSIAACARAAAATAVENELKLLMGRVQIKLREAKKSEPDFGVELKAFDELVARHGAEKTDAVAQVLLVKALVYAQCLNDAGKATSLLEELRRDYPETRTGQHAPGILQEIQKRAEAKQIRRNLAVGTQFPDFEVKDLLGEPLSLAPYRGKVVLIDFWATWCAPCVSERPNVLKAYEAYHGKGFEIIGISLDRGDPQLKSYLKDGKMTWPQFSDGNAWDNKLAIQYGVDSIPASFLLDAQGVIIAKDLRGEALQKALSAVFAGK